ncbi:FkbM family methyltransferase [Halalkalicoccus subterraneus]|uniref:FkbM family methyltransferase n=1 Tax=Halalkalicoccus subterraneus TaxID=2675002 RepID=UPI000EFA5818|nr:FkbM family methyltransferase [Halalkalicoccus subterraneus]
MLARISESVTNAFEAYREAGLPPFLSAVRGRAGATIDRLLKRYTLYNPSIPPLSAGYKLTTVGLGYRDKYIYTDSVVDVAPGPSDVVVETGVYHGKHTAMYAKLAERVIAFEPSPRNHAIAERNLERFDNVELVNRGLWNEEDELEIRYGDGGGDDGFLDPDTGSGSAGDHVPVHTLEDYIERSNVDGVDFLKVEAEGAEPEIIDGMGELRIENVVVNAGEEREGKPTGREVTELLQPKGYTLVGMKRGHILFFTLKPVPHAAFRNEFN